ncbi:hypothetical protein DEO72_LG4g985 [Vigna unguiculata]|uniref:Uncharacterized protein n=1 Tax=Vigna unguiculata TaxID=3917 RepID=A0A4D6LNH2_VIGUN|nr:hypothetical protein DEO72_LG4g985 [Vigna unguiculata]
MYSRHKINTSLATTGDCSIEWRPSVQATTRTLTPVTLANLNTAQGMLMLIRHPKPQLKGCHSKPQLKECHVFTLYLEPQLKRYHYDPQLKEYSSKFIFKVSPGGTNLTASLHTLQCHCSHSYRLVERPHL